MSAVAVMTAASGAVGTTSQVSEVRPSRVAVIIPVLNEERYIAACLASLLPQAQSLGADVIVVDGGSTDGTASIVREIATRAPNVSLLRNPRRLQSAAMNLAAQEVAPDVDILVRADAHAVYPPTFLRTCAETLRSREATSVVVPMRTVGKHGMQRAIATVQNSRVGNGGASHRVGGRSGFVEHGHHAAFDRDFFLAIGGYDEGFSHNEDAEHDVRAHQAGGRIWMCREATIDYLPRSALWPLARQYYRHGRGRMQTLLHHGLRPRLRQLAAPTILVACIVSMLLMPLSMWFGLIPLSYAATSIMWGAASAIRARDIALLAAGPALMTVHLSWGAGFISRLFNKPKVKAASRPVPVIAGE